MINFDQLNTIILLGDQIKTINPVMAYYIKYHAIKRVLAYVNSNFRIPNFKQIDLQITKIRQEIEQLKKQNQQRFLNFDDDMKMIEDSTLKLFNHLDDKERQGSCDLASSFIFCAHMMALLFYYLPKRLDFKEKKMYSQFKALDQYQKLECSGVIINNIKVHIGMFVDSYLFDPQPQIQQQYQPQQQKQHIEPPTIKAVKVQPTESMMAFQELQKKTKDHIQAAISELDFKNIPNSISKVKQALDCLNQLLLQ